MSLPFKVPDVQDNPDGWGPCAVPEQLKDVPFLPFSKNDKLGKAADWTQAAYHQKYPGRYGVGAGTAVFNFFPNEEEDSFHLVDSRPQKTTRYGRGGRFAAQQRFQQQRREREERREAENKGKGKAQQQKKNTWQQHREQQRQVFYSCSVDIRPEWAVREQIPFSSLAKLSCSVGEGTDVLRCGCLEYYDRTFDRITPKADRPLAKTSRVFRSVTASDDPVIKRYASEGTARVFATERVLTTLMCARSSVYSWDVVATRVRDQLFLDARPGGAADLLTVNETAPDPVPEDPDSVNGVQQLALESTTINQNFSQAVLAQGGDKLQFEEPNPFASPDEDEELASCAYRYRRWTLNPEEGVDVIVRCELDGALLNTKGEEQLLAIKALNEFDFRATDWRKKLEAQRGAVLALETKNNKNKIARWTAAAVLAGADSLKLGYVSRCAPKDNTNHVILGTQVCKPKEFAAQISLSLDHCWGIVRALVDMLLRFEEGKYLLVKDPNKELLRMYAVPEDAFEQNYADEPVLEAEDMPVEPTAVHVEEAAEDV